MLGCSRKSGWLVGVYRVGMLSLVVNPPSLAEQHPKFVRKWLVQTSISTVTDLDNGLLDISVPCHETGLDMADHIP